MRRQKKKYFKTGSRQKYVKYYRSTPVQHNAVLPYTFRFLVLSAVLLSFWFILTIRPITSFPTFILPSFSLPEMELPTISLPTLSIPEISVPDITFPDIDITLSLPEIPPISLPEKPHVSIPYIPVREIVSDAWYRMIDGFSAILITIWESLVSFITVTLIFLSDAYQNMLLNLQRFFAFLNPVPYAIAAGETMWSLFQALGEGILAILRFLDPRPFLNDVKEGIGNRIYETKSTIHALIAIISPYVNFVSNSFRNSWIALVENTKDLYYLSQYLMEHNS